MIFSRIVWIPWTRWVDPDPQLSWEDPHLVIPLHWRHHYHDGVSNHQPHNCLLNRLFRRRSKKTSKLRVTGLCVGKSPGPVNSPHQGPVTRKMFPFDDVIMTLALKDTKPSVAYVDYRARFLFYFMASLLLISLGTSRMAIEISPNNKKIR